MTSEIEAEKPPWYGSAVGRNANGTLAAGWSKAGVKLKNGNPDSKAIHAKMEDLKQAELSGDPCRLALVWNGIAEDAVKGDRHARTVYLERMLGKAPQAVSMEVSGMAGPNVVFEIINNGRDVVDAVIQGRILPVEGIQCGTSEEAGDV